MAGNKRTNFRKNLSAVECGNSTPTKSRPISRLENSLTYGNIWLSILSLMKKRKVYAYALPSEIKGKFGFEPSRLMAYFVLYKLEADGLVSSGFEGRRKYYALSKSGRKTLDGGKRLLFGTAKKL